MKSLYPYLQEARAFWWARNFLQGVRFSFAKAIFKIKYGFQDEATQSRTLFEVIRITLPQLIFAITFAFLLKGIDAYLYTIIPNYGWAMPEDGDYTTLLATIGGIGGVFIGLYYAAVTTVGSSIYSRVPNNIRDLLARERVGNVYMRYLAFLTFLALALICSKVLGIPRIRMAILTITILSGIGVVAFIKLGQRAFYLFDPTALSASLFHELQQLVRRASVGGFGWGDPAFQNHANKVAQTAIATLETLAEISGTEKNLSGRPFAQLCKELLSFLIFYEQTKATIPSDSYWYTRQMFHRDWYRTEDSRVSMAHQTGTTLVPELIPNMTWVEDQLLRIVTRCIVTNTKCRQYDIVLDLLGYVDAYIKALCRESNNQRSLDLVEDIAREIFSVLAQPADALVLDGEVLESIGLVDYVATLSITSFLSFVESQSVDNSRRFSDQLRGLKWNRKNSLYTRVSRRTCCHSLNGCSQGSSLSSW